MNIQSAFPKLLNSAKSFFVLLSCKCTMLKIQGLTLPQAAVNFELRKQENVSTRTDTCCIKQNKKFAMIVFNWDFSMEFHQSKYRSYPWIWGLFYKMRSVHPTRNIDHINKYFSIYLAKHQVLKKAYRWYSIWFTSHRKWHVVFN